MQTIVSTDPDEKTKHLTALRRAVPITRMVDYGVPLGDAMRVHEGVSATEPPDWDNVCERLALRHIQLAEDASRISCQQTASQAWRAAAALLQCAQLAYNADLPRKRALYERSHEAIVRHAALSTDLVECVLPTSAGRLHGWIVHPLTRPVSSAVIVLGGLSGWGAAYLDMGRALAARGILAILGEGPGQGLSRMQEGIYLDSSSLPLFEKFLDHAQSLSAMRIGVWGNSFGGLFAAQVAVRDKRVSAVCINGAPLAPIVPSFRTPREQMEAMFNTSGEVELANRLNTLALIPKVHRTDAAMLVVQGGRDTLVPLGTQMSFFDLSTSAELSTMTWDDGEHTIYNHFEERNSRIADWFVTQLNQDVPAGLHAGK